MKSKHPQLFKEINYLECDVGWQDIISSLANTITHEIERIATLDPLVVEGIYAVQIKEKFGGLRFYMNHSTPYIDGAISLAESMSYKTCETCGNRAGSRHNVGGWIKTCCDKCLKKKTKTRD